MKFEHLCAAVMDIARPGQERVFMRWIITVVVVAGKEQNSRSTDGPTDQTTPGQRRTATTSPVRKTKSAEVMMVFAAVALAGRKGC